MDNVEMEPSDGSSSGYGYGLPFSVDFESGTSVHPSLASADTIQPGTSSLMDSFPLLPSQQKMSANDYLSFPSMEQASKTNQWLSNHYELSEGYSLPKCLIYNHYRTFCEQRSFLPVNTACFGKVIRHAFPQLTTRRLGSRGQSKYHYYGIKVKTASLDIFSTSDGGQFGIALSTTSNTEKSKPISSENQGACNQQLVSGVLQYPSQVGSALVWASSTLLPEFPDASHLKDVTEVLAGQVNYLITSYRSHCIQVLETVLRGGLNDVGFLIKHFWQHLNETFRSMLGHMYLGDTIAICDTHLYHTVVAVLIPGAVQPLPSNLLRKIRNFACCHEKEVENALSGLPQHIIDAKLSVAKQFVQMLHRKTTLAHLAQASRSILTTDGSAEQMKDDWEKRTEHKPVSIQVAWSSYDLWGMDNDFIFKKMESYGKLLDGGHSIEDHIHWLEMLVKEILDHIDKRKNGKTEKAEALRSLILQWSYLSHLIVRDQTLRSAVSFGSFHLLNLLYQEYLLYIMDIHCCQEQESALWKKVFGQDSEVSQRFLTFPVMCDLEECILHDNPYKMDAKGQSTGEGNVGVSVLSVADSAQIKVITPVFKDTSRSYQYHLDEPGAPSSCVLGQTSLQLAVSDSVLVEPPTTTPLADTVPSKASVSETAPLVQPHHQSACLTVLSSRNEECQEAGEPSSSMHAAGVKRTNDQMTDESHDIGELSTKIVRVIHIPKEEVGRGGDGDAGNLVEPFFIKISIPRSDEMKVVRGQVLMTEDGRSFMIDEVDDGQWEKTETTNSHNCSQS